jgi:hypothetical protein
MTTQHSRPRRRLARAIAGAIAGILAVSGLLASTSGEPAQAATPLSGGDILITTFGGLDGSGVDKLDRITLSRSRWTTFGLGFAADKMTVLASRKLAVGNKSGEILIVDPDTGATRQLRTDPGGDTFDVPYTGFAAMTDGRLATIVNYKTGGKLVFIDTTNGSMQTISSSQVVDQAGDLVVRADGNVILTAFNQLWKVDPHTGTTTAIAGLGAHGDTMTIDRKGNIYVHVEAAGAHSPRIMRLDALTDAVTTVAEGGELTDTGFGMAVEATGFLVVDDIIAGNKAAIIRLDPDTGNMKRLATIPSLDEARDVAVAGVAEVGGVEAPIAADDFATFEAQDGQVIVHTLDNDRDPRETPLHYATLTNPQHGFISAPADGSVFYFPGPGFAGQDSWTYKAISADGRESKPATVHVTVSPSVSPVAHDDSYSTATGRELHVSPPGILHNDTDPQGDAGLRAQLTADVTHGDLVLGSTDGSFIYQPDAGYAGADSFGYRLLDPEGHSSSVATVHLTVTPSATPTASDDFLDTAEGKTITLLAPGVLNNDTDPEGSDGLTAKLVAPPTHGTATVSVDGATTYTPTSGFFGTDAYAYTVIDPEGHVSVPGTVHVTVVAAASVDPVANGDSFTATAGTMLTVGAPGVLANDADPQGPAGLVAVQATQAQHGTATLSSGGKVLYAPVADFAGTDSFTYFVQDPNANESALATVTIVVRPAAGPGGGAGDGAPTVSVAEGPGLRAGADGRSGTFPIAVTDPRGERVTLTASSSKPGLVPAAGIKVVPGPGGARLVTITATKGRHGRAVVTLTASDGPLASTLSITVIVGNGHGNRLKGTAGADLILGAGGGDRLVGGAGRDVLSGGLGADLLNGGSGADALLGGPGHDRERNG